ncbi:diaminopimelate decarboxylase [Oleiphilus messinensis]|uniref:Diaminopimelate decarboxylase n=1 Tax=Oleiphilus messinensis TaxID=141451 RepID=A0A1Y0I4Z6_9GAMM|nr:diaminopimelate decarboxylase [Oleiphilus messinensis]ARU54483.1 diaminopimelate decarboxylase [Oleiphilus messinensis]
MDYFQYQPDPQSQTETLYAEGVALENVAKTYGTPTFVYSRKTLTRHFEAYDQAFGARPHLVCYAVKANSNIGVLSVLARLGAGFDIVSVGELERVLKAGGSPDRVMFSGVGKQADEMARALEVGVHCFNVESLSELRRLNTVAGDMGKIAPVSFRVNPDVDAGTHPYISTGLKENKFGIDIQSARAAYEEAKTLEHINVIGVDCHIGSQLTELAPFLDALDRVLALIDELAEIGITIRHLDLGGGLGVKYRDEVPPAPADYIARVVERLGDRQLELVVEPGRSIAANAGVLLTRVEYLKETEHKNFAIIDGAMNDLIRPSLYSAWQEIVPTTPRTGEVKSYDLVGPVCETGDFLGKDRDLVLQEGDLLAVRSAGAYGFSMSSNYNSRNRACELMVDGDQVYVIRKRESIADQLALETVVP